MSFPPESVLAALREGLVIPAHPLALNSKRKLDEKRQRALTRYYHAAGAGGVAVGVHTTQFEIRDPQIGLFEPVLSLAAETLDQLEAKDGRKLVRIAGIVGKTAQALKEAETAKRLGYHLGLVSMSAWKEGSNAEMLAHMRAIAEVIPIFGFYLQPAVGGRLFDYKFWRELVEIENLLAIKIAPFNRYLTLDVVRAVANAGKGKQVSLYTGNDDNIVLDLLTQFDFREKSGEIIQFSGGLLGQWAVWTQKAVEMSQDIQTLKSSGQAIPQKLLTLAAQLTDVNAALFDPNYRFVGCIPGIHEILRRQGLLEGRWTLNPAEELSPGQMEEIDRVCTAYPHLQDDEFVKEHLDDWLR